MSRIEDPRTARSSRAREFLVACVEPSEAERNPSRVETTTATRPAAVLAHPSTDRSRRERRGLVRQWPAARHRRAGRPALADRPSPPTRRAADRHPVRPCGFEHVLSLAQETQYIVAARSQFDGACGNSRVRLLRTSASAGTTSISGHDRHSDSALPHNVMVSEGTDRNRRRICCWASCPCCDSEARAAWAGQTRHP